MLKSNIVNVEQAESWDGGDGDHWTDHDEIYNGAVARHHEHFMRAAAIEATERVLDVGCGTGVSTCDAARAATSGSALGVDLSSRMLARAEERAREQGLTNVRFERADAQVHDFGRDAFDVALSRFGAMFFGDHTAALRNVGSSLRRGGRVVLMSWLPFEENVWIRSIRDAFAAGRELPGEPSGRPGPFGLSESDYIRTVLGDAGFAEITLEEVREPMWFGATAEDAFAFWASSGMNRGLLGDADDGLRARAHASLRRLFNEHQTHDGVLLESAAWLTTARKA
jgi:SAM-dependent methyltransferase